MPLDDDGALGDAFGEGDDNASINGVGLRVVGRLRGVLSAIKILERCMNKALRKLHRSKHL